MTDQSSTLPTLQSAPLLSVFKKYQSEFVFHLAAQSLVRLSYKEPRLTYETNIMGTINVLEKTRIFYCIKNIEL